MPLTNPQSSTRTVTLTGLSAQTSYDPTTSTSVQDKQMIATLVQIIKDAKIIA